MVFDSPNVPSTVASTSNLRGVCWSMHFYNGITLYLPRYILIILVFRLVCPIIVLCTTLLCGSCAKNKTRYWKYCFGNMLFLYFCCLYELKTKKLPFQVLMCLSRPYESCYVSADSNCVKRIEKK